CRQRDSAGARCGSRAMSLWRWILLLAIVAALAAFGWHWVAVDPGYVLVRLPFGALSRRHRRLSRKRLAEGLIALMEGRHGDAERDLNRASRLDALRGVALLASAEAASRRGEHGRALEILAEASQAAPQ